MARDEPRNDEYTSRIAAKETAFGWDWEVAYPDCRPSLTGLDRASAIAGGNLDFHYWSHYPDQGIYLCRGCHNIIGFERVVGHSLSPVMGRRIQAGSVGSSKPNASTNASC
ncbi:hypothetical protein SAMN06265347_11518 [Halobellus salinus]|nr:hypothetical protein SAMN06265347_11518 [Halobellus salinus]